MLMATVTVVVKMVVVNVAVIMTGAMTVVGMVSVMVVAMITDVAATGLITMALVWGTAMRGITNGSCCREACGHRSCWTGPRVSAEIGAVDMGIPVDTVLGLGLDLGQESGPRHAYSSSNLFWVT